MTIDFWYEGSADFTAVLLYEQSAINFPYQLIDWWWHEDDDDPNCSPDILSIVVARR